MESTQSVERKEVSNVSLGWHQSQCTICKHPQREEIEEGYLHWRRIDWISSHHSVSGDSIYRRVRALGLDKKRRATVLLALERLIESGGCAIVSSATALAAIKFYVKITGAGLEVKSDEGLSPREVLDRMSQEDREAFAKDGSIPDWVSQATDATSVDGQEDAAESVARKKETLQ